MSSSRVRIAFVTCPPQGPVLERLAARFSTIADVQTFGCRGDDVEGVLSPLTDSAPHVVVADPTTVTYLSEHLRTPVLPFEFNSDGLALRIDEALQACDSVGLFLLAGTVSPLVSRFVRRTGGAVHLFTWETRSQLRDLMVRSRRMGVGAAIGGATAASFAVEEGLQPFCVYDREDETDGVLMQLIAKAAVHAMPSLVSRREELVALGLILEKITQGAIGPHDTALCLDARGRVVAVHAPGRYANGAVAGGLPALPAGISLMEALTVPTRDLAVGANSSCPLQLDLYPLSDAGCDGYLMVIRGEPGPRLSGNGHAAEPGMNGEHADTLLKRVDTLLGRTETLIQTRRTRLTPRRFLGSHRRRTFLLDWSRVRYFELRSGLVYAAMANGESYATNYALTDILARVDPRDFFRIHRHVVVNLNYVTEVERYGQGQLRVVLEGPDAPSFVVSRPASVALRKLLKY